MYKRQAKNDVILNITAYYLQVLQYKELVRIAASQVELSRLQVNRSQLFVDNGKMLESELLESKASWAQDKLNPVSYTHLSYHAGILAIFLAGSLLYACWVLVFLKQRRKLDYKRFQQAADNQSSIVQMINGMQEIKLNNCEKQKRWEWERIQAKLYKISIQSMTLGQTQQVGGLFIDQTKNVFVSFLAAKMCIRDSIYTS